MKLSNKSRYGLRALIDLAASSKNSQVSLKSIAERNQISLQYLEQSFAALRKAGIVKSIKGPQGGYYLGRDADTITISEILEVLEGNYRIEREVVTEEEGQAGISHTIQTLLIDPLNQKLDEFLGDLTLADLESHYVRNRDSDNYMYYI